MTSIIRNHDLAAAGQKKIAWVEHYMPTLNNIGERLKKEQTFDEIGILLPIREFEKKMLHHLSEVDGLVLTCREKMIKKAGVKSLEL